MPNTLDTRFAIASGTKGLTAGISFRSVHDPRSALTCTVISNSSDGAWPIARRLHEFLAG
jgi:hypothetical protein